MTRCWVENESPVDAKMRNRPGGLIRLLGRAMEKFRERAFQTPGYGMPVAFFTGMNALREYGKMFAVYLSFIAFLAAEVTMIYFIYRYLGVI